MSIDQKPRHRPFTEHSHPAGNMPDIIPTEQDKEIKLTLVMGILREAFAEVDKLGESNQNLIDENAMLQQSLSDADIAGKNAVLEIQDANFNLANRTTERDVAWAEVKRLEEVVAAERKDYYQIKRLSSSG